MADLFEEASQKYPYIPKDCFRAKVDFNIKHFPDNVVVPRGDLTLASPDGVQSKWIKVSSYQNFISACKAYGFDSGGLVVPQALRVVVMPYMPLEDAFHLHSLIEEPDLLFGRYEDALQQANLHNLPPILDGHMILEEEEVEDEEQEEVEEEEQEDFQMVESKIGNFIADDLDVNVGFTVINYGVLWFKADLYCMLSFIADPVDMFFHRIQTYNQIMATRATPDIMEALIANVEQAKRHMIFSMYHEGIPEAHDALRQLYHQIHDQVYLQCQHCIPSDNAIEDSPDTMERLNQALAELGYADYNPHLSVEQAGYNLMIAEGRVECNHHNVNASTAFTNARQAFRDALVPLRNNLMLARQAVTLMGVVSAEENAHLDVAEDDN